MEREKNSLNFLCIFIVYQIYREQRVTGILVFVLTGVSIFLAPVLKVGSSLNLISNACYIECLPEVSVPFELYTFDYITIPNFCAAHNSKEK